MGSSESTGRSNGGEEEEPNRSGGTPNLGAAAVAIGATAVAIGAAAWGVSRMLSDNKLKDEMNTAFKSLGMDPGYSGGPSGPTSPPRRFKLNTDGACRPNNQDSGVQRGPSGYAGILEDDCGRWVRGFRGFIGVSDSFTAELYGVFKGLELLDKLGYMESVLESDSQPVVQWVTGQNDDESGKRPIVRDCWKMIVKSWELALKNKITIRHCSRDVNKDADKLATVAINKRDAYVEFTDVYGEINS